MGFNVLYLQHQILNTMRYQLEKYRGPQSRYCCPQCGRKGKFTRYIDTQTGRYIDSTVGMCSRREKCGYHLPPRQWFEQHRSVVNSDYRVRSPSVKSSKVLVTPPPLTDCSTEICTIDKSYMQRSMEREHCAYLRWLRRILPEQEFNCIRELFNIGSTEDDRAIFWQVDVKGRVRTGKVMAYDENTGKRLKNSTNSCDWVHSILKREGKLPKDWTLTQCLYGEHLLNIDPIDKLPVAIVESYKTVHIAQGTRVGNFLWTAVDSLNGLTANRLSALFSRRVVLFPDTGAGFREWKEKIVPIANQLDLSFSVSTLLIDEPDGYDMADKILDILVG